MKVTIKQTGFTLIELMVAIMILAIILSFGIPSFRQQIMDNKITTSTNEFVTALSLARIEAVKRGTGTVIVANSGGGSTNEWGKGYAVKIWDFGANDDAVVDSGEIGATLRVFQALDSGVSLDSAGDVSQISFFNTGAYNSASSQVFTLCDSRSGERGRQITLNATGTFNLDREHTCP